MRFFEQVLRAEEMMAEYDSAIDALFPNAVRIHDTIIIPDGTPEDLAELERFFTDAA